MKKKTANTVHNTVGKQLQIFDNEDSLHLEKNIEPAWKEKFRNDTINLNDTIKRLESKLKNIENDKPGGRFLWQNGLIPAMNRYTGNFYSGENLWLLWEECKKQNYTTNNWATNRQWQKMGAQRISPKDSYTFIKLFLPKHSPNQKSLQSLVQSEDRENNHTRNFAIKHFRLYNIDQVSWNTNPYQESLFLKQMNSYEKIESFIRNTGVTITHGDEFAHYNIESDVIKMPFKARFTNNMSGSGIDAYYSLIFQEMIIWVIKNNQLQNINVKSQPFEKLVAELGGSMLSGVFKIIFEPNKEHYMHYDSWLKMLDNDIKILYAAQNQALNALNWLMDKTNVFDYKVKKRPFYSLKAKVIEEINSLK